MKENGKIFEGILHYWATGQMTEKPHLRFYGMVSVIFIPTRTEFKEAGIASDIWWAGSDYINAREEVTAELQSIEILNALFR